tara:strand:- start:53 stop:364 length:312 start_codon:yes stop_codon:yes gene_type:complete
MLNRRLDKRRVFHAAPVNSMLLWALLVVHCVYKGPSLVEKEETAAASIVRLVGRPKTAVPDVPRAVRVRLALGVEIVHWVLPDKGMTMMRLNANNVNWAQQHR